MWITSFLFFQVAGEIFFFAVYSILVSQVLVQFFLRAFTPREVYVRIYFDIIFKGFLFFVMVTSIFLFLPFLGGESFKFLEPDLWAIYSEKILVEYFLVLDFLFLHVYSFLAVIFMCIFLFYFYFFASLGTLLKQITFLAERIEFGTGINIIVTTIIVILFSFFFQSVFKHFLLFFNLYLQFQYGIFFARAILQVFVFGFLTITTLFLVLVWINSTYSRYVFWQVFYYDVDGYYYNFQQAVWGGIFLCYALLFFLLCEYLKAQQPPFVLLFAYEAEVKIVFLFFLLLLQSCVLRILRHQ